LREAVLVTKSDLPEPKPKVAKTAKNTNRRKQSANRPKVPAKAVRKNRKPKV